MLLLSLGASVASPPARLAAASSISSTPSAGCPWSGEAELWCGCLTQDGASFFGKVTALVLP